MKTTTRLKRQNGMTLIEVLLVLAVLVLIAIVLVPTHGGRGDRSRRAMCVNHLKQILLADKNWGLEHDAMFPWRVSTNAGGSLEHADLIEVFRHFSALSKEIETPEILVCPSDRNRAAAKSFARGFSNTNVSYFVGLDADENHPESIVHGDRNIVGGESTRYGSRFLRNNTAAWASNTIHRGVGNIVAADGSVSSLTSSSLRDLMEGSTNTATPAGLRLAIPRIPGE